MSIDSINSVGLESTNKMDSLLSDVNKRFFNVLPRLGKSDNLKEIEYGGFKYYDSPQKVHIPLRSDFKICEEYDGSFKENESKYMVMINRSKYNSGQMELKVYQKSINSDLNFKSLIAESKISTDPQGSRERFELNRLKAPKNLSFVIAMKNISKYLDTYFAAEDSIKLKESKEEMVVQEILERKEEEDPDVILQQLWEDGL